MIVKEIKQNYSGTEENSLEMQCSIKNIVTGDNPWWRGAVGSAFIEKLPLSLQLIL